MSISDYTRIGRCSICGGDVMAFTGMFYMSIVPPGPPTCSQCGAVEASHDPVIPMSPRPSHPPRAWEPLDDITMWDAHRGVL